jgi:hypothetical protein
MCGQPFLHAGCTGLANGLRHDCKSFREINTEPLKLSAHLLLSFAAQLVTLYMKRDLLLSICTGVAAGAASSGKAAAVGVTRCAGAGLEATCIDTLQFIVS